MRKVALFRMMTSAGAETGYREVRRLVEEWVDRKYEVRQDGIYIRRFGTSADYSLAEEQLDQRTRLALNTYEMTGQTEFETQTRVLLGQDHLYLQIEVRTGRSDDYLGPQAFVARAPGFFLEALKLGLEWKYRQDADRLFAQPFPVDEANLPDFLRLIQDDTRRLPVIAISRTDEGELVQGLSGQVAVLTAGVAHTCVLSKEASWGLTEELGPEWSCYNQAIRIYWPRLDLGRSHFVHRLWLPTGFRSIDVDQPEATRRIAEIVANPIIAQTSFASGFREVEVFATALADAAKARFEESLAQVREGNDYQQLERLYADENDRLRALNQALQEENEDLRSRLDHLSQTVTIAAPPAEAEELRSLVAQVQDEAGGLLLFADQLDEQIASINPLACPIDKLADYLKGLVELATEYRQRDGRLGRTVVEWCKRRGLKCSGESETKKGSGLNAWQIDGRREEFALHLKPTDGTAPDRCVRIYFKVDDVRQAVMIGFLGSKTLLT